MTETPKVDLELRFCENLIVSSFLSKSLPPGVQGNRKKLGGRSRPPLPWVLKGPKSAGLNRVKKEDVSDMCSSCFCQPCANIRCVFMESAFIISLSEFGACASFPFVACLDFCDININKII